MGLDPLVALKFQTLFLFKVKAKQPLSPNTAEKRLHIYHFSGLTYPLFNLKQFEGGRILEDDCPKTQQWLQRESWIREVCKFMSANNIYISHLGTYVSTQHNYDACLMTQLSLNGNITTLDILAINRGRMYKEIFFLSGIFNNQGTQLIKPAVDNYTPLSMLHDFNWTNKHHTSLAVRMTWRKALRNL